MARIATPSTTVGEVLAWHEADLARALVDRDWAAVQVAARRLKRLDRMLAVYGPDAGYTAAVLSGGGR
jgi:hypothetical protein